MKCRQPVVTDDSLSSASLTHTRETHQEFHPFDSWVTNKVHLAVLFIAQLPDKSGHDMSFVVAYHQLTTGPTMKILGQLAIDSCEKLTVLVIRRSWVTT